MPWRRSLLLLVLCVASAPAADWPQWLGPNRDCSSPEIVVPWKEPLKVLWHKPVGEGHSSPVVAGGKVFLHTKVKDKDQEEISRLRRQERRRCSGTRSTTGPRSSASSASARRRRRPWWTAASTPTASPASSAASTPPTARSAGASTPSRSSRPRTPFFGMACSPLVDDGKVYVAVGGEGCLGRRLQDGQGRGRMEETRRPGQLFVADPLRQGQGTAAGVPDRRGAGVARPGRRRRALAVPGEGPGQRELGDAGAGRRSPDRQHGEVRRRGPQAGDRRTASRRRRKSGRTRT